MATVTQRAWSDYVSQLRRLSHKASTLMERYYALHAADSKALIRFAHALTTKYGDAAVSLAAEYCDKIAAASGIAPVAVTVEPATVAETAKVVNGTIARSDRGDVVGAAVGRLVKRAGADTTLKTAISSGAEWAWVPNGDTCAYCLALAADGWHKASADALSGGHADHIHANCDCTYAIRYNQKTKVAGYNPDRYRSVYDAAEGETSAEKLRYIRRRWYRENADMINAQKREAYRLRVEKQTPGEA